MLIIIFIWFLGFTANAQPAEKANLVIFYFGATSCGPCNRPEVIESIKKLKTDFPEKHKEYKTKFVMVCMDQDIEEGIAYLEKYGFWDEVSIGSHYQNELVLNYLSKTNIPGVPHILIFKDFYEEKKSVPVIKERQLITQILGGTQIVEWVQKGFPLEKDSSK